DDTRGIASLSHAIDLYRKLALRPLLSQLLMERGRAHARLSDNDAAERDFRAGIDELEHQRRLVEDADLRISYLDRAESVFADLALVLLRRGQSEEAFDLL